VQHVDTYLDTFDWSLLKNKAELQYRVWNGTATYCLKKAGPAGSNVPRLWTWRSPSKHPSICQLKSFETNSQAR